MGLSVPIQPWPLLSGFPNCWQQREAEGGERVYGNQAWSFDVLITTLPDQL